MLVPFVIDRESLTPENEWTPAQTRSFHKSLLDIWQGIGCLTCDGSSFESSHLRRSIESLPQELAILWQEMLGLLPLAFSANDWSGQVANSADCLALVDEIANVAIVDDATAEVEFEFSELELSRSLLPAHQIEMCRLHSASHSPTFRSALGLGAQHIPAGLPYKSLWSQRFYGLAKAPLKRVTIVDRFALSQHYECPQHQLSGYERFLRLLDTDASGKRYVTLYSAWTRELNDGNVTMEWIEGEVQRLRASLPAGNIRRIKVVMLPNQVFGNLHHDRFVRFEKYVWDLGGWYWVVPRTEGWRGIQRPALSAVCRCRPTAMLRINSIVM